MKHQRIEEILAEIEHEQWMRWATVVMQTEHISEERSKRWKTLMIPYKDLPQDMKEADREWARKAMQALLSDLEQVVEGEKVQPATGDAEKYNFDKWWYEVYNSALNTILQRLREELGGDTQ